MGNGIQRCAILSRLDEDKQMFSARPPGLLSRNFNPFDESIFLILAGFLVSVDSYMNLQLASTEEYIDGQFTGNLGEVLIRCNNVLFIRAAPEDQEGS